MHSSVINLGKLLTIDYRTKESNYGTINYRNQEKTIDAHSYYY